MRKAVALRITGHVQGVWFRGWMVAEARVRRLDGWVRNRRDDRSVEAVVAGEAATVDELVALAHHGPDAARVDKVGVTPADDPGETGFRQVPTV